MRPNHPEYSPLDVRVALRIAAGLLIWKTLSADYTNLIDLARPPRPLFWGSMQLDGVTRALERTADRVFVSADAVRAVQLGLCAVLAGAAVALRRWLLIAALVPAWAFHCYAAHFLAPIFEAELCLCVLFLAALWPGRWDGLVRGGPAVTPAATTFGCTVLALVGGWYFLAGLSKLVYDPNWVARVHMEHMWPTAMVWNGSVAVWEGAARWMHDRMFAAHPWAGPAAAAAGLGVELAFPLAVVSRWARWVLVPGIIALHLLFFLSVGTLFLTCIGLVLAATVPWRRLAGSRPPAGPAGDGRFQARGYAVAAAALALHAICAAQTRNYYPVVNWCVFGWHYQDVTEPVDVYQIGFRDPAAGQVRPFPQNHGGFLDYRFNRAGRNLAATYFQAASEDDRAAARRRAENLLRARRPEHSNQWLLGPLAYPSHSVVRSGPDLGPGADEFYFMKGRARFDGSRIVWEWDRVVPLTDPPARPPGPGSPD